MNFSLSGIGAKAVLLHSARSTMIARLGPFFSLVSMAGSLSDYVTTEFQMDVCLSTCYKWFLSAVYED